MSGPSLAREVDVEQAGGIGIGYATVHLSSSSQGPIHIPRQLNNVGTLLAVPPVHGNSDRDGCRSRGCPASEAYPTQDWPSGPACPTLWLCTPLPLCHPLLFFLGTVPRPFMAPPLMEHATPLPTNFITCKAYDYMASMDYVIIAFQPPSSVWALLQLSPVSVIGGGDAGQCTTNMHTLEDLLCSNSNKCSDFSVSFCWPPIGPQATSTGGTPGLIIPLLQRPGRRAILGYERNTAELECAGRRVISGCILKRNQIVGDCGGCRDHQNGLETLPKEGLTRPKLDKSAVRSRKVSKVFLSGGQGGSNRRV
ncbi:hypothetical protein B0H11DRAFT_2189973 [Mycena galericulata]|nr:hypothetical protein B0H11DRAFT_2189973 [Mycena galericulata]